ncbi:MAG: hypothetical protein QY323_05890 [Patescibacteria group bacterium]|nr:MAG: hypothetical protein QY323_05890 [Patescibacteria group bacterium]
MADPLNGGFESVGAATDKELRWSQWWVDHKEQVKKTGLGIFIAFDAILIGAGFWGFIDWLAIGGIKEEQAIRQMTSPEYGRFNSLRLEEIQIGAPIVLSGGSGKIDILAPVENRNATFWADIEYRFLVGGAEQPLRKTFILPGQAKYLSELGASSSSGASVELKIESRTWRRVDLQGASSAADFAAPRLDIRAENPVYLPSDPLATVPSSSATFTLVNGTAYGYYEIDLLVLLYRGDAIVGVNKVQVDTLAAGERKPMQLFWYQLLPQVTKVQVVPEINIFDPYVYRSPRG